jgi:hypothetical protein
MYSPLNEDYMFQEMHDRVVRISPTRGRGKPGGALPNRRWWHRGARLAR